LLNFFNSKSSKCTKAPHIVKSIVGEVRISHKQARKLGLSRKTPVSPGLEKCCLRACAKTSYEQAAEDIEQMMAIKVGHSTLHRMVAHVEIPLSPNHPLLQSIHHRIKRPLCPCCCFGKCDRLIAKASLTSCAGLASAAFTSDRICLKHYLEVSIEAFLVTNITGLISLENDVAHALNTVDVRTLFL
jgi:hypothetical protein